MGVSKKTKIQVEILSLLNQLERSEAIDVIERIGKRLRQGNSKEIAKEVEEFARKTGNKKDIEYGTVPKVK